MIFGYSADEVLGRPVDMGHHCEIAGFVLERPGEHAIMRALANGEPVLIPEITNEMLDASATSATHRDLLRRIGPRSLISVPLLGLGRILGAVTLVVTESARRYGPDDLAFAQELARRAALAVENARLFHVAQQATRARDDMLAIVAHDLRNPLGTILLRAVGARSSNGIREIGRATPPVRRLAGQLHPVDRLHRRSHPAKLYASLYAASLGPPALSERMDTVEIRCACGQVYHASVGHVGKRLRCRACTRILDIVSPEHSPAVRGKTSADATDATSVLAREEPTRPETSERAAGMPDSMSFMPGGPLPCCPHSLARHLRDLDHVYGFDFDLYECVTCGRHWVHAFYEGTNMGGWEDVTAEDVDEMIRRQNVRGFMRQWARARGFD